MTALGRQETWEDLPEGYPQSRPYKWWNWHDALCPRGRARPEVGRSVRRRRSRLPETHRRRAKACVASGQESLKARPPLPDLRPKAATTEPVGAEPLRSVLPMNRDHDKQAHPMLSAADWISLAAAPTFAVMALLTVALGGGRPDMLCSAAHGVSPLSGMVPMYLLMSAFHSAPWLKLISRRREDALSGDGASSRAPC